MCVPCTYLDVSIQSIWISVDEVGFVLRADTHPGGVMSTLQTRERDRLVYDVNLQIYIYTGYFDVILNMI